MKRSNGGSGVANKISPKRSRGGGRGGASAGEIGGKTDASAPWRGKGPSGTSWNRNKQADESLPYPCIVAFGGSALRTGGGYAQAELHVLETPKPEGGDEDEESEGEEGGGGILEALESSANTRRQSFNRFQT